MAGTLKKISGPAYLAAAAADIYTPAASTIYTVIRQIHVANKTAGAVTLIGPRGSSVRAVSRLSTCSSSFRMATQCS